MQLRFGRPIARPRGALDRVLIAAARIGDRQHPARAARPRLLAIEAAVDQNPRQPHLEREVPLERRDVRVGLDEGILHRFVGFGHIAQVVPGNARRAALLARDDLREQVARGVVVAGREEILHLAGERRFDFGGANRSLRGERISPPAPSTGAGRAEPPAVI